VFSFNTRTTRKDSCGSGGIKTVNLPDYIPLSMSAIEKRKANIKEQLLMGKGSDSDLIAKGKKLGLL
jgi:hypothetical protein